MQVIWKDTINGDKYDVVKGVELPDYKLPQALYLSRINGVGIGGFTAKREAINYCKHFPNTRLQK
jgi:hypothetical protein